ncbi:MAG: glycosyltransferase family protein [Bacteroidota bacterium]
MQPKPLHILVSPLDWGLGHASRCIPLIRQLLAEGHQVTLAGYGRSISMLQQEFPALESIELKGFSPEYPRSGRMIWQLSMLLPQFISSIISEYIALKQLIAQYRFDVIISDNRYGLWNKKTRNILITHQVMIKVPRWLRVAEYSIYLVSRFFISRFDECWIPDYTGSPGLSGDLSHKYILPQNAKFIGPLSRFQQTEFPAPGEKNANIAVVISGPEPQRSIFEDIVIDQLSSSNRVVTIVSGKPESNGIAVAEGNLTVIPYLSGEGLHALISASSLVICRSGYSSIMDLEALGARALFVPTPGQTEQIYLAGLHQNEGTVLSKAQGDLSLETDIPLALTYPGFRTRSPGAGLKSAIAGLGKK